MFDAARLFCDLILDLGRKEKKLEVIRQVLCEIPDFEPYSAFRRVDKYHKNFIDETDIQGFLLDKQMEFSPTFIKDSYMQHYDLDGDSKLVYAEFLRCLLPADHPTLRTIVSQRPIIDPEISRLSEEIEYTLAKLISEEVSVYVETEGKKRELSKLLNSGDYDSLFLDIDDNDSGYIDFNNLMSFLQRNGIYPYEEEIIYILRRLDKDDDGRISLLELQNEITPKESLNFQGSMRPEKGGSGLAAYENPLGKITKNSASKSYPYEAIRRSASPMKSQLVKSPLKGENASKLRSHRKDYPIQNESVSNLNRDYREYVSNTGKDRDQQQTYESPKKRLEFDSVNSGNKKLGYSNTLGNNNYSSPPRKPDNSNLRDMKSEIEQEMNYYKKGLEFREIKSEVEREMLGNSVSKKYKSPQKTSSLVEKLEKMTYNPTKPPENQGFEPSLYQSLSKKVGVSEAVMLEIAQLLKLVIRAERELQYLRGDLSLRPDYNITELFNLFDKLMKGYLNPEEIEEFFEGFEVFSSQEKNAFLQRFCKTKEIFNFVDFVNVFQGNQDSTESAAIKNKRQSIRKPLKEAFSPETFGIMKEIVRTLVKNERIIEETSKDLLRKSPVDLKEVFAAIDVNKNGVLNEFEIKRFLEKNDIFFNEKDIKNLMDRVDRNKRRSMSLNEFYGLFHN